jgi:2-oxo-4-hydroxy-4-carboxy-5-ureidoimidazoline decarboxylase
LAAAADETWWRLTDADWREAFEAHPKIGDRATSSGTASWSRGEQARACEAPAAVLEELQAANREYEARFGFIYIVCATGRSADEILTDLRARLGNPREVELRIAATEQARITAIRLRKLIDDLP